MECGNWGEAERWREVGAGERKSHGVCCAVECGLKRVLASTKLRYRCAFGILCPSTTADYDDLGDGAMMVGGGSFMPDINRPNITSEHYSNWVAHLSLHLLPAILFTLGSPEPEIGFSTLSSFACL